MNLQYFPMDRQLCIIEIESFGYSLFFINVGYSLFFTVVGYSMDHIRLSWYAGDDSVVIESDVSLPQFRVLGYSRKTIIASTSTGNYSRLLCEIMFCSFNGLLFDPDLHSSSLIVVISWVSFWLNRAATPARVSLGVTTVLTMTTLMSSTNAALPKISYNTLQKRFKLILVLFVLRIRRKYAAVGYLGKRIQMRKNRIMNLQKLAEQRKAANAASEHPDHNIKQTLRGKNRQL
ncbi:Gamma-aminobutyric acid receptor subunit beta [Armadillidium vulgare]|nr:Gamma-aminobutyric acid receptor subunit beta [Armadillidium vulgare]